MIETFKNNWRLYLMEAAGLAFFMVSACFFGGLLWSEHSALDHWIRPDSSKLFIMGLMMGLTALLIFYSPFTNRSGAHINPAVTITFFRLGRMTPWNAFYYILFQFLGGTLAVCAMAWLMGPLLTDSTVNYVVTVPSGYGRLAAAIMEFSTAFIMMSMVLFTSSHPRLSRYTRLFAATLVMVYVIIAGPVSGFGMNPARTFASALPAGTWTSIWLYMTLPVAGMLTAAEIFLVFRIRLHSLKCFHLPASPGLNE